MSLEFFEMLYADDEFCAELGRLILATGKIEASINEFLDDQGHKVDKKATFGRLVGKLKEHDHLTENGSSHFDELVLQRNTFSHNIYKILGGGIEGSILPSEDLIPSDVYSFALMAKQTADNINGFSDLVTKEVNNPKKPKKSKDSSGHLFK